MIIGPDDRLTRIGVFYDGGYFAAVSDYYRYAHKRKQRMSVDGVHRFIKHQVAKVEGVDERYCQVVDAHYFRGRFAAAETQRHGKLYGERSFDDVLMRAGVTTHYFPRSPQGEEKAVDVAFALEAFELAVYKRFNVLALLACDGDYLPLIRKLNTLGTRVLLLAWDFDTTDTAGSTHSTRVSQLLIDECTYVVQMHDVIDARTTKRDPIIDNLFLPTQEHDHTPIAVGSTQPDASQKRTGTIDNIPPGENYGFIADENPTQEDNLFFLATNVKGDFSELRCGHRVRFKIGINPKKNTPWATDVTKMD